MNVSGSLVIRHRVASFARWFVWAVTGIAMVLFLAQPVSVDTQLLLSITVILAMAGIWWKGSGRLARMGFLTLGSLVVLRYIYWRATSTLPSWNEPVSLGIGAVLFAAELYCVLFLAVNLIINSDPLARSPPPEMPDEALPNVDVFVPSYNEDEKILAMTLSAARRMDYPAEKFTVWLLDDGGTDQKCNDKNSASAADARARRTSLQALCTELGVNYLARERNEHAKAGNLNAGLKASNAEIIAVFDADHVPFRQFLRETVGYFAQDEKLFLVQTPHVFLNPDPIEKNLSTFERMPSENEMFYSITQRGLDKWDGSFFCGSAALLRRTALDETGGFSGITITEDCETAFELHAKGWSSLYVDKPLIAGLQPETFTSFIGQRSRWCQGMFQIMLLKSPAIKPGLRLIQRLAYLSSMTFWLFPLPRMIFMLAPLLHIFFDVKIFVSSIDEAIAYTATYIVVNLMLQNYLYGRVRWPWMSELYEYVQGVFLTKAILSVLTSPRKPTFNVTAKGQSLDHDHLSRLAPPFVIIFAILAIGVLTAGYRYMFEPGVTSLMLVVGLWTLVNLVIAGAALGAVAERKQTDRFPRLPIQRTAELSVGSRAINVTVENVSAGGCAAAFDVADGDNTSLQWGAVGELRVKPLDGCLASAPLPVRIVRSEPGAPLGLAFKGLSYHDYSSLADLMYGDAAAIANFLERRRGHMDLFRGTVQFLIWSVEGPFRVARLALAYRLFGAVAPPVVMSSSATHAVEPQLISVVSAPDTSIQLLSGDTGHPGQLPLTADQGEPTVDRPGEWANLVLKLAAAEPASINTQIGKTDRTLQVA